MKLQVEINCGKKPQLYMHKEDQDTDIFDTSSGVRPCAATGGCPAVFVLKEPALKVNLTKDWQYYLIAINYNMTLDNVSDLLHYHLAFANNTGFGKDGSPRRNYILERDLNSDELPKFDKDRTCSRSVLTGTEVGGYLKLTLFNGNLPPPMKLGKPRPQRIQDINIDDYLYNPREHRWMFCVANRVTTKPGGITSVAPFPRGAIYNWTGDNLPYTFVPHVSTQTIYYPLRHLVKVNTLPSPYRIVTT